MKISRRDFLKYCVSSAVVLGIDQSMLGKLSKALANTGPNVLWLTGSSCTGCTVSLANLISPTAPVDVADLLINVINLDYHINLMGAAGDLAVENLRRVAGGSYILVVEGGIPSAFNGNACILWHENGRDVTALEAVRDLAAHSIANISVGTCASFGGVAAAAPNPTQVTSFSQAIGKPTINISGCPTHPDWVVWTIAQLLAGKTPALDASGRPVGLFGGENNNVHENCPRHERDEAKQYGVASLCLKELGCKGPQTQADCPKRRWNNKVSTCIDANSLCLGCTESRFPDGFAPLFKVSTTTTIPSQAALAVSSAAWNPGSLVLSVAGTGKIGSQAVVKAPTGELLATSMIGRTGGWMVSASGLATVPASVVVQSDGASVTANVTGAPATKSFAVTSALYTASTNKLAINGTGVAGATVTVKAGTVTLGAVTIATTGSWSLSVTSPSPVPSSVTSTCNGVTITTQVSNAPAPASFVLTSAQYTASTNKLAINGTGVAGATVTVKAGTVTLGSVTITSTGSWSLTVTSPSPVPTSISATCNGVTLTAVVQKVVETVQTLTITRADWDDEENKLYTAGKGTPGKKVSVYNDATSSLLGTATVNSKAAWSLTVSRKDSMDRVRAVSNGQTVRRNVTEIDGD